MEKIVQIVSVDNLYVTYKDKDGKNYENRILILGLDKEGEIIPLDMDSDGIFDDPREAKNFVGLGIKE